MLLAHKISPNSTKWARESFTNVLNACRNGARKCDIAKTLDVSIDVVNYLYGKGLSIERSELRKQNKKIEQIECPPDSRMDTLSKYTQELLRSYKLCSVEIVRAAMAEERFFNSGYGAGIKIEVQSWLNSFSNEE